MIKKTLILLILLFFAAACSDTVGSVKRGLTGSKANSSDEFLIQKKDPLILPPDFENLPTPDERILAAEEVEVFEKFLKSTSEEEQTTPSSSEDSILKKIQSK